MKTQEVIEGLLYITDNRDLTIECLRACHILNDSDRNWEPMQHSEFHFLDSIKYCSYLIVIDKQVHVYLLGERSKGRTYNVLNVEGFTCNHMVISKGDLIKHIKAESKITDKLYLPESFGQRIIFLKPDYINNLCNPFIFNRLSLDSNMFRKSSWNFGTDIYSANQPEYTTKCDDILKEILNEVN